MMKLQVGEDYRIETDNMNYILKKRHLSDPNHRFSSGVAKETWNDIGYFGKLEHLVRHLIEVELKTSEMDHLHYIVNLINSIALSLVKRIEKENE